MVCINHMRADEKNTWHSFCMARSMGRKPDKNLTFCPEHIRFTYLKLNNA